MTDTTTIEITEAQRDALKARKEHDRESYKAVVGRLLSGADGEATDTATPTVEVGTVELEASERRRIAEEVVDALR